MASRVPGGLNQMQSIQQDMFMDNSFAGLDQMSELDGPNTQSVDKLPQNLARQLEE